MPRRLCQPIAITSGDDGRMYADQIIDLIRDACVRLDVAATCTEILATLPDFIGVVLVATPIIMVEHAMFEDGTWEIRRDLLKEAVNRLYLDGRIIRPLDGNRYGRVSDIGHVRQGWKWRPALRHGLYVAPKGEWVPFAIHWANEATHGPLLARLTR